MRAFAVEAARRAFALAALAVFASAFAPPDLGAAGRRDIETFDAGGEETWQREFDVSEWRSGTHNIIIHARDRAGNETVSGPYNLRVDPNAALPTARVIHPESGAIIRQDISILGVGAGRYGIERIMVRLNDGEEAEANGTEFWDKFIDLSRVPDGRHALYVRAHDAGGLYGPVERVGFVLDTAPPAVELTSHSVGGIISGNVRIHGRVSDANGIRGIQISEDGENFSPLFARGRRDQPSVSFSFPIRTRDFPDGPVVFFLRAMDNTGLVTTEPLLFFVSNTPPELEILSPLPGEHLFGSFMLSGRAHSPVGIARIEYQWGRLRGSIEARLGDPYWHEVLELGQGSGSSVTVTVTDNAGNSSRVTRRLEDRRRDRLPSIVIDYPAPEVLADMPPDTAIYGRVEMGSGRSTVNVRGLDSVESFPAFRIDPSMLPLGRNVNFRINPVDSAGASGAAVTLRITRAGHSALSPSRLSVSSPPLGGWVAGDSVLIAGSAAPGARVQFRLAPSEAWRTLELDEYGAFSYEAGIAGRAPGPAHLELRTATDLPAHRPFNIAPPLAPQLRFVSPSAEPDPERGPRLVSGSRTVVGALTHPVPISAVAFSLDGYEFEELPFSACGESAWFTYFCDFTTLAAMEGRLSFRVTDAAGREIMALPVYAVNPDPPLPVAIVNSPVDGQLFTTSFEISGIAYDEVGIGGVRWRILGPMIESIPQGEAAAVARLAAEAFLENPDIEFSHYATDRTFSIPVDFSMVTDGEYVVEVYAVDVYGVRSEVVSRSIRISTAPPETRILHPIITEFYYGTIAVRGVSLDANGIASVSFSMDGGSTWQETSLEEDGHWEIPLNTAIYSDGVSSALIRAEDNYGVYAFTIAMINIDNTPPDLYLSFPESGQNVPADMLILGRVFDNMSMYSLSFQVISAANPQHRLDYEMQHDGGVVSHRMSLEGFPAGSYVVRVVARDLAGNESIVSREVTFGGDDAEIAIFNPFPGETATGAVSVVGTVSGSSIPETVRLVLGEEAIADVPVDRFGIFRHVIPEGMLRDGEAHGVSLYYYTDTGERISSPVHTVFFSRFGPVLTIDSHSDGDVITQRPWISGRAFVFSEEIYSWQRPSVGFDEEFGYFEYFPAVGRRDRRRVERELALESVQVSYDNGHTFMNARRGRGDDDWRFRIEAWSLPAGHLPVLVRAQFSNGQEATRRVMLYVDAAPPMVQTLAPSEGTAFRDAILVYGIAGDNNNLASVDVSLRPGNKAFYSVPGFLQGAFICVKALGATFFDIGFGLSFFDDNVRFQFQWGLSPAYGQYSALVTGGRYTGNVFGIRLLANIFSLPFSWFLGPDWAFFSMNFAVGANFSWFAMDGDRSPLFMSAVIGQWDFANLDMREVFPNWRFFRTFAFYLQPELWFATSDVQGEVIFRIGIGLRTNIF